MNNPHNSSPSGDGSPSLAGPDMTPSNQGFLRLCQTRCSVRRFAERPVPRSLIEYCAEAARLAPSAENAQPWRFVVFDDETTRSQVARAVFRGIYAPSAKFAKAPVLVALIIKENIVTNRLAGAVQGTPFQLVDAGIAGEHFVLAAAELGLGTCWIGWYDGRALSRFLGLSKGGYRPVCLIALGYPAENQSPPAGRRRRPLRDILFWNGLPK